MNIRGEWKAMLLMLLVFAGAFYMPLSSERFWEGVTESLHLLHEYAREHVILCLLPALLIAGGLAVFLKKEAVMKYLGPKAKKAVAYGVASVSGSVLAVCSCTVLPLFAGIYRMGAGLGPASAFLYAGPAINVLAIILSARVLGIELGVARAVGAVVFSVVIGLVMQVVHGRNEGPRPEMARHLEEHARSRGGAAIVLMLSLTGLMLFSFCCLPPGAPAFLTWLWRAKAQIGLGLFATISGTLALGYGMNALKALSITAISAAAVMLGLPESASHGAGYAMLALVTATSGGEPRRWAEETWGFAKLILPLLFAGVLVAGALLGRPGREAWIPSEWVETAVGGNSLRANVLASVAGAFMYFATLTEIPIVQGLLGAGMGRGPALALLLAGPALSLPNMLVIGTVLGTKKTVTFVSLVIVMAAVSGVLFGAFFPEVT